MNKINAINWRLYNSTSHRSNPLGGSVCLFQRTTKMIVKQADEKEARLPNSVHVAIAGEEANRGSVLLRNIVLNGQESASNPPLHPAATHCASV